MGFCFNRQLRMIHSLKDSVKNNKKKQFAGSGLIRQSTIKRKARSRNIHRHQQLSAKDYSFLRSLGLEIRSKK